MIDLSFVLLVLALVFFLLAGFTVPVNRISWRDLAYACVVGAILVRLFS